MDADRIRFDELLAERRPALCKAGRTDDACECWWCSEMAELIERMIETDERFRYERT